MKANNSATSPEGMPGLELSAEARALFALKKMKARLEHYEQQRVEPIAVIGMSCRMPAGGTDLDAFWTNLHSGKDCISEVPPKRWDHAKITAEVDDPAVARSLKWGAFLDQVDQFDPEFFGLTPREVAQMDPQHRLLLETNWEALENAGIVHESLAGSSTGVYVGFYNGDYAELTLAPHLVAHADPYAAIGTTRGFAAGRIAYLFDLQGPTMVVDTICSSSLLGVHLACQALRSRECDLALASGVNVLLTPGPSLMTSRLLALSSDGRCKTFDAHANGYVRGEACGTVVLKRLSDALAAQDRILGLIRGSAVNQDGRSTGLTAPNASAQQAVIRRALAFSGVDPASISYIEAHGTGTPLGDPIEVESLKTVYGKAGSPSAPCYLTSVKTHLGHTEGAAGIVGLIKVLLCLQHRKIPPHLHYRTLNPRISLEQTHFEIPTQVQPWNPPGVRRAAISSFGMSGTNVHMVLEEASTPALTPSISDGRPQLLLISGRSDAARHENAQRLDRYLESHPEISLADAAFTLNLGRTHFTHRAALIASSIAELRTLLVEVGASDQSANVVLRTTPTARPKVAFLFTGQGAQYVGMGQPLFDQSPTFNKALRHCAELFTPHLGHSLIEIIRGTPPSLLDQTRFTQPALFALDYALAQLWISLGITPDIVAGHSVGEYVAATLAGILSLEEAIRLVAERAQLMQALPEGGGMLALFYDKSWVDQLLLELGLVGCLAIAGMNAQDETVVAGPVAALQMLEMHCTEHGLRAKRLTVSHAFHSPLMDPMLAPFRAATHRIAFERPSIPIVLNVEGQWVGASQEPPLPWRDYWVEQLRRPVDFVSTVDTLRKFGTTMWIECGPKPVLLNLVRKSMAAQSGEYLPSLRDSNSGTVFLRSVATASVAGAPVDLQSWHQEWNGPNGKRIALPTYAFQRQRHWVTPNDDGLWASSTEVRPVHRSPAIVYQIAWQEASKVEPLSAATRVVLISEEATFSHTLANQLASIARAVDRTTFDQAIPFLNRLSSDGESLTSVVLFFPPVAEVLSPLSQLKSRSRVLLEVVQRLLITPPPMLALTVVTGQGVAIDRNETSDPVGAGLWALARSMELERPALPLRLLDYDAGTPIETLAMAILDTALESQTALRGIRTFVPRLKNVDLGPSSSEKATHKALILGREHPWKYTLSRLFDPSTGAFLAEPSSIESAVARSTPIAQQNAIKEPPDGVSAPSPSGNGSTGAPTVVLLPTLWDTRRLNDVTSIDLARAIDEELEPIVEGLNTLVANKKLPSHIVTVTSIAAAWGLAGFCHRAAVHGFLQALASSWSQRGTHVTAISTIPWQGQELVDNDTARNFERLGLALIDPSAGGMVLLNAFETQSEPLILANVDWPSFRSFIELGKKRPLFSLLTSEPRTKRPRNSRGEELMTRLPLIRPEERQLLIVDFVQREVASIMGFGPQTLPDIQTGLFQLGMDSLMAVELKNRLEAALEREIPATVAFDFPTIEALSSHLLKDILELAPSVNPTPAKTLLSDELVGEVSSANEEDLARMVEEELAALGMTS